MRTRDLRIVIGQGRPGPFNAITDVPGVGVGHATLIEGDGPLVVRQGPVRTGVTVVTPRPLESRWEPVFAGCHRLNGNGELTGLEWVRESGLLTTPIGLTNTHSVGVVRDAIVAASVSERDPGHAWWSLPVVGETWDGLLNDVNGFHVRAEHLATALAAASGGPVAEGGVGGGTGSICHEFKGGIGTSSRVLDRAVGGYTLGVLVQANHGRRSWFRVDGVAVGEAIGVDLVPSPYGRPTPGDSADPWGPAGDDAGGSETMDAGAPDAGPPPGSGSIIVVIATDAPLLPHQCERIAQRAGLGIARAGGTGGHTSGDLFIAFATGNHLPTPTAEQPNPPLTYEVHGVGDAVIDALFDATIEATEEAIINAIVAAETMTGRDGVTAHAIPHDRLVAAMAAAGRLRTGG